jgi:hypothetical protein
MRTWAWVGRRGVTATGQELGNLFRQSSERDGEDNPLRADSSPGVDSTAADGQDGLDEPDGPPEPVAQERVLPGALFDVARHPGQLSRDISPGTSSGLPH